VLAVFRKRLCGVHVISFLWYNNFVGLDNIGFGAKVNDRKPIPDLPDAGYSLLEF